MDTLHVDLTHPLRSFRLELTLALGAEPFAVVGPSGAGKTTLLRAIAGLVTPERGRVAVDGEIWLDTERAVDLAPEHRSVGFVFQEYALFPHMTVAQNVAYGGADSAAELLARLGISHLARSHPHELSGGERQRVALARALARRPRVLLLDEPLAALDTTTRERVRGELRETLRDLRLPTILVTHDYTDAAALTNRIGVLVEGRLVQVGTPDELTSAPASPFVADFTGVNLLHGRARARGDGLTEVTLGDGTLIVSTDPAEGEVGVVVYPWEIALALETPDDSAQNHVRATIRSVVPVANRLRIRVGPLTAEVTASSGERLGLRPGVDAVASFKATGTRLVPLAPANHSNG